MREALDYMIPCLIVVEITQVKQTGVFFTTNVLGPGTDGQV